MKRGFRKPLIIMAPKSLLRHKECTSKVADFTDATFTSILDDETVDKQTAKRIIFCSGKVYYDLTEYRSGKAIKDTAIVRIEQLYPLNIDLLKKIQTSYPKAQDIVWCQEEPKNMGAWSFIAPRMMEVIEKLPRYAGRNEAASPAVGSIAIHKYEQTELVEAAFSA